ncbi:polysaccharide deacetylase family protein [Pelagibacterium halotolerans]|uniref:polysaccharide deacetylase family protein n=1 Tax=Pelagibacterium halotolerans TaxID=531813 RepID=UPI000898DB25|nr:polysaccharide deacetylase family protein [Pelagibacterium halotolerans]QJR18951.1 polysaccharide deacetylase family protein [Pelagibacterium halotolerans]SEA68876.1 Peptidoglycan/xylan/chitin deacetylase, PgdA/CDA1 family [Pelagibacterium halotolerans]
MPRYGLYRAAFEALAMPGVTATIRRFSAARGLIFTLHRVLPDAPAAFSPNSILQIRPDFLEAVIVRARKAGFDIVDLDEAVRRVAAQEAKPFIVLTFDDGYRDNLVHALPILRRHAAPFTLYIPTGLVDGVGLVWWQALEDIIAANEVVVFQMPEGPHYGDAATIEQKNATFADVYERYRKMPEPAREASIRSLAQRYGLDLEAHCRDLIMDWSELKAFADEPLCTIGAHTVYHYELSKLPQDQMRAEIGQSANVLEAQFGSRPRHLSFPIGGVAAAGPREFAAARELGFATAVTTRPGGLYVDHAAHLHALPRVSLNGLFQQRRFIDVFLTAEIFTLMRRGRRLDVD